MATVQLKDNDSGTNKMGDAEKRTQRAMSQHLWQANPSATNGKECCHCYL